MNLQELKTMVRSGAVDTVIVGLTDPFGRQKCFDDTLVAPVRLDPHGTLFGLLGYTPIHMLMGLTALWIVSGLFRTPKMRTNPGVHA